MSVHDAGRLTDLGSEQPHLLLRQPESVHLDVERLVRPKLGDDPTGQDIEILKALEDPRTSRRDLIGRSWLQG